MELPPLSCSPSGLWHVGWRECNRVVRSLDTPITGLISPICQSGVHGSAVVKGLTLANI